MHSASTLGTDIIKRSNSVGVAFSRRRYTQSDNIVLYISAHQPGAVTPAAKRNTYSVAMLAGVLPRVAGHARNPGLWNRNSYRVAVGCVPSTMDFPHIAIGCVPSTMYFGLKLHTENLIIIPHGMPWGIIVLILMTPALPCLLFPLI